MGYSRERVRVLENLKIETNRQTICRLFGKPTAFAYHDTLTANTA